MNPFRHRVGKARLSNEKSDSLQGFAFGTWWSLGGAAQSSSRSEGKALGMSNHSDESVSPVVHSDKVYL